MPTTFTIADPTSITAFCERWRIQELALFGSVLTDKFDDRSDVDVMVTFETGACWSLLDMVKAEKELSVLLGRPADLVERASIDQSDNWIRRRSILANTKVIYAR